MKKIKIKSTQQRSAVQKTEDKTKAIVVREEGSDSVFLEFPFSSEFPVERWFGNEILSHDKGCMKTDRLENFAPLLFNHNWDEQLGVVEKVWMDEKSKRAFCRVKMSRTDFALEKLKDIEDGILMNVSFGYEVYKMKLKQENKNAANDYLVTEWMPHEVSFVTIPADFKFVGLGRSVDPESEKEIDVETPEEVNSEVKTGEKTDSIDIVVLDKKENPKTLNQGEKKMDAKEILKQDQDRRDNINNLGGRLGMGDLARTLADSGKSFEDAKEAFLEKMGAQKKIASESDADIGLSDKEAREFSIARIIQAKADPENKDLQRAAAFEIEVSDAAKKKYGKTGRAITIPMDVLRKARGNRRDLVVGTDSAGGNLVAEDLQSMVELLRSKSVLKRLGATVLSGLNGNVAIPRQSSAATAYWVGENSAPTEGAQAFDQISLSPKTIAAYTDFSRKLLIQSAEAIEQIVRLDLTTILALGGDLAGVMGSGSANQPAGLNVTTGIGSVNFAADTPTFAEIVQMESEIAGDNADVGAMKYLFNAAMRGSLKTKEKASNQAVYVLQDGQVNGYGFEVSNQLTAGDVWLGVWNQLLIGEWSGIDIMVDPFTGSKEGFTRVTAFQDIDYGVRHPEAFCKGANNP